nr:hypothetical protein [Escherichia coli]
MLKPDSLRRALTDAVTVLKTSPEMLRIPAPDVIEELDFETILAERKATLISLYPEDQQEAVARTLTLESEPL